jgi:ADP-ribosyl-[dinitrogen reductase] hydrolase
VTANAMLASRLRGAVWGHLVGDALGVPYEFKLGPIRDVRWGHVGTHGQPPGTWSDDGGLMLALLDSLLTVGFDLEDQARRAVAWMDGPDYKPGPLFDIGTGTWTALARVKDGVAVAAAGGRREEDNGNGALMRVLPIALVEPNVSPCELARRASLASRVTHAHPRSRATCAAYCLIVQAFLTGERDRDAALRRAFALAEPAVEAEERSELGVLRGYEGRSGSGYVLDCFWSAWDAFRAADSYQESIERAIGFGNDTDTTGAVTGGLAGAYWGIGAIPTAWLSGMHGRDIVEPLVTRLLTVAGKEEPA